MLVLILVAACVFLTHRYMTRNHDYWAKRNVKHDRPLPFFGNHLNNFLVRRTIPEIGIELLRKYKDEKIVGYFRGITPELIIKDPEIVRYILTVDFKTFADRGWNDNTRKDPLLQNIVFANVAQWREMRPQLSPGFTLHKLRKMSPQLLKCIDQLERAIEGIASRGKPVKAYDLLVGYTIQSIAACGFGVELNTISEGSLFADLAKKFFVKTKPQLLLMALTDILPDISFFFNYIKVIDKDLENMIMEMTKNVGDKRKLHPSAVKDFMDIFLSMAAQRTDKNNVELSEAEREKASLQFTASQLFFLLFAGFETSATAMSTTLHQLAHHPEIQVKIQEEVDLVLSKHDNKLMECLDEMTLLDMAFKESMRLLTPLGAIRRVCAEKYTIPGTDITIDRGVRILIPIQALHMDPEIYDRPEEFRPERFASEAGKGADFKYLAFGEGPRKCIGL